MRRYSAHLGYLFANLPLEERFAAAANAGFSDVEHPAPYALAATQVQELCAANGLTFVQMALPAGDTARGEKGLACLPGREREFRESVAQGLDYAQTAGSRFVHVMAGVRPNGASVDDVWPTYIANLRYACGAAAAVGLPVLVEPIGIATIADYLLDSPAFALKAMDEIGAPNLSMLFDAFHAKNAGTDPTAFVRRHGARISHIHISDHPGRHEPGTGTLDFVAFFCELDSIGYGGAIGLEYIPAVDTLSGFSWR